MIGCVRRIGCALLLLVLGAAGWHWRALWLPKVRSLVTADAPATTEPWAPVTAAGAARAKARIASLRGSSGPAYVNVPAADFAALLLGASLAQVTAVDSAPEAIVDEGTLYLRLRIRLADLGGKESLGPLARMFSETEPLLVAGRLEMVRPGLAQLRVSEVAIRDLRVPGAGVARLVTRWGPAVRPDGAATTALPVELPLHVVDLRIADGRITLYRAAE